MNPFTILGAKLFAGLSALLLVVVIVLWWQNGNLKDEIEEGRNKLAECEAARRVQNAAITAARQEGERARQEYAAARESGNRAIAEAAGQIRIVRQTARSGCPTPPQVMGADL